MSQPQQAPVSITSARAGRSADIRRRQTKYLVSMGVRTLCFVLAIVVSGWLRWVFVGGAFLLPYFAVVVANATDARRTAGPASFVAEERPQIGAAASPAPLPDSRADS